VPLRERLGERLVHDTALGITHQDARLMRRLAAHRPCGGPVTDRTQP
jgi:hypothetical protein